jgi:hypothetical protein
LVDGAGKPVDGFQQVLTLDANQTVPVTFAKPVAPPSPPPAEPKAAPPAAAKPAPPVGKGPFARLEVQLVEEGVQKPQRVEVEILRPHEYVEVSPRYDGGERELIVEVTTAKGFSGPPCEVVLVIPGLVAGNPGISRQKLAGPAQSTRLIARSIEFQGPRPTRGLIFLTVDDVERAFIFQTDFRSQTGQPVEPVQDAALRLRFDPHGTPKAKYPVRVEVDNPQLLPREATMAVGLDRDLDRTITDNEMQHRLAGARQQQLRVLPPGPDGALMLQAEVHDWQLELDTDGLVGATKVQASLVGNDPGKKLHDEKPLILDGSPPENVQFGPHPPTVVRGARLPLQATGSDPESGIRAVYFFLGKPPKDAKAPPPSERIAAAKPTAKEAAWSTSLEMPAAQKGPIDITVQFINGTGQDTFATTQVQVVDPPAAEKAAPSASVGTIRGTVVQGRFTQAKIEVVLLDEKGVKKATATTDANGAFVFEKVAPGNYTLTAVRPEAQTQGKQSVAVKANMTAKVNIELTR